MPTARPKKSDPLVMQRAQRAIAETLCSWCNEGHAEQVPLDAFMQDAAYILKQHEKDGYRLARDLERHKGYEPDAALVERLDDLSFCSVSEALDQVEKEWVQKENIRLPLACLDKTVTFDLHIRDQVVQHTGVILNIDPARAKVTIYCEAMGHVRQGPGTLGIVVNWEDVSPIEGIQHWPGELPI